MTTFYAVWDLMNYEYNSYHAREWYAEYAEFKVCSPAPTLATWKDGRWDPCNGEVEELEMTP